MSERRIYLDEGVGETRGVVAVDGLAERLLIRRDGDDPRLVLGARLAAVTASVEPQLGIAFLDLGEGAQAVLQFKPDARPVRGAVVEVEIRAEPRRGKQAIARALGPAEGRPRLLAPAPGVVEVLSGLAKGAELVTGRSARDAADAAEAEALETLHPIPGGGLLAIEPTRALTAIDVDLGDRAGSEAKRVTRAANLAAIELAARLLRLKSLGGLVVLDLVGRGHDAAALLAAARAAFAPDNPGVAVSPVGRFGTMEISLPRRTRPLAEILGRADGTLSDRSLAQRLLRRLAAEAEADPGARLAARCAPAVALEAGKLAPGLAARIGARFSLEPDAARDRASFEVARTA
jgi:Ribonuclease G/E